MDRNIPARGALRGQSQLPPGHWALMRWTTEEGGIPLPRLPGRSQRSRMVEATTPSTTAQLVPHDIKGAPSNGGTAAQRNPPGQRQRWGEQHQSPPHPRLCVDLPYNLIGGPRKKGGSRGETAWRTRPKGRSSTCGSPRCLFGFFLGIQKEARRRSGETLLLPPGRQNIPRPGAAGAKIPPAPQAPTSPQKILFFSLRRPPARHCYYNSDNNIYYNCYCNCYSYSYSTILLL